MTITEAMSIQKNSSASEGDRPKGLQGKLSSLNCPTNFFFSLPLPF